ncbi:hypothetical protein OIE69_33970 [Actinacidiphila glaucinigra]|uniref:hypothetical protein n=1 Tax=Actinacidiphila glaucinigra TaxID=235986 RepID=UPI002DDA4282|nr:hypothetical protein [Actinacidiphila glaucinigra]WSD63540.1 hypothetical protein OIE69_33970 [Actinacidiphila glaucinigra]
MTCWNAGSLNTARYVVAWTIAEDDEKVIAQLPAKAWEAALKQDSSVHDNHGVAELTGLNTRPGWPDGMRLPLRRVRPGWRHQKKLTDLENKTGWKYPVIATVRHM